MGQQDLPSASFGSLGLNSLPYVGPKPDARQPVAGIAVDSREVRDGYVFVAIPGERLDGAEFAGFAIRQGAIV